MIEAFRAIQVFVPYIACAGVLAATLGAIVTLVPSSRRRRPYLWMRLARNVGMALCAALLAGITLAPGGLAGLGVRATELVPFRGVMALVTNSVSWQVPFVQIFGNVAMFVPLGALVALDSRWTLLRVAILGASLAAVLEIGQYVLDNGRVTSVDDVMLAALGMWVGALLVRVLGAARVLSPQQPGSAQLVVAETPRD